MSRVFQTSKLVDLFAIDLLTLKEFNMIPNQEQSRGTEQRFTGMTSSCRKLQLPRR
jgi:hypothetical protein